MTGLLLDLVHAALTLACVAFIGAVLRFGQPSDREDLW